MPTLIDIDYDPFAEEAEPQTPAPAIVEPAEPEKEPQPAVSKPEPEPAAEQKPKADYVIPPAPALPTVEYAGAEKPRPKPKLVDIDYDPFAEAEPEKTADSWVDPKDYATARGAAEGIETLKGGKEFLTVLDLSLGGMSDEDKLKTILSQEPVEAPTGWERREPTIAGVGSLGEFATWFQESAGSAVTSTMPGVIGGALGALGGSAIAPGIGTAIGAYGGAMLPSMALGLSGMYNDLRSNEGVRKALQDGTLTVDQFQKLAVIGGLLSGGLDAFPAAKFGGKALGLQKAKDAIRDSFIKAAIKGSFEEGGTEGLQQIVTEAGQAAGGGSTGLGQAAMNVLEASLQGMVGGLIFGGGTRGKERVSNEGEEQPPKVDDVPEVSSTTEPEGTPAETTPAAGEPTPGSLGADTPAQPAGTEKQPEQPQVSTEPVPPEDPRTLDKPPQPAAAAAPARGGGVETVLPGAVPSDIAAGLSGAPVEQPAPRPAAPAGATLAALEEPEEFNLRETFHEETPETEIAGAEVAQQARMKEMFRAELEEEDRRAALAATTRIAPPGDEIAAALQPVPAQQQPETLGTGIALAQTAESQAAAAPATMPPAAAAGAPMPAEAAQAAEPAGPVAATPITPVQAPAAPAQPALVPQEPAAAEQVAAFTTPAAPAPVPLVGEPAAAPPAQEAPAPVRVGEPVAVEPVALPPRPGAKGEALKAKARKKRVEVIIPKKPAEAPAELIRKEAPSARPEAERAPAAAPAPPEGPPKAVRTQLSRDAADAVEGRPELQRSTISELGNFRATLDDVAAEVIARKRKESPELSLGETMRASLDEIVAETKRRLEPHAEAAEAARVEAEEKATKAGRRAVTKEEKEAAAAKKKLEGTGQKKARVGKKKGLAPAEIRVQSEESVLKEYEKELKKPPEAREPLLLAYGQVHHKQVRLKKNPPEAEKAEVERQRAEYKAQKRQIQELRAQKVEAAEAEKAAKGGLSERAEKARDQVQTIIAAHPLPPSTGSSRDQDRALLAHLKAFKQALRDAKVQLADHVDRTHQSMEENLAIFTRKVKERTPTLEDMQKDDDSLYPYHFSMAQLFQQTGADKEFYDLVTNQKIEGSEYREDIGAEVSTEASRVREDTRLESRVHRQEFTPDQMSAWGDAEALIRSGRGEVRARAAARAARDEAAYRDFRRFEVTNPRTGEKISVRGETRKGSDVLREINRMLQLDEPRGFVSTIRNALVRHLTSMVGDIDVHFVSSADMRKLHGRPGPAAGLYYNYSPAQRKAGLRPQVFLDEELVLHQEAYAHTALHELTHAATSLALNLDIRGTARIIEDMRLSLFAQLSPAERAEFDYAFTNVNEFLAEAMSNARFQELLSTLEMPADIRKQVSGLAADRKPSWWDGVVGMVSNAVGMLWGRRGHSYMEQIARLYPSLAYTERGQLQLSREAIGNSARAKNAVPRHPVADAEALLFDFRGIVDGSKSRYANAVTPSRRRWRDMLTSSGELMRRSAEYFGGPDNPLARLLKVHVKRDQLRSDLRKNPGHGIESEKLELAQAELQRTDKKTYNELSRILHEASRYAVDPTVPLNHPNNGHIYKTGSRHQQVRAMHAQLEKDWNALKSSGKTVGQQTIDHYRATAKLETEDIVRHSLDNAMKKFGATLPAGKTIDDAIQWIMSGHARRDAAHQTQADKDFHSALGKTAATVANVPMVREPKGVYVPFMRRGKYFISATERPFGTLANPKNLPAGATLDAENRLLFRNEADLNAFADAHPTQVKVSTLYVNPYTGQKTTSHPFAHPKNPTQLVIPRKVYVATVQNKRVEMSDNQSQLVARARELAAQGHHVSDVGISQKHLHQAVREMAPPEVTRLIRNLEQTTIGQTTVGQQAVGNAVYDAYIRQLTSPGALARGLKRTGVLGEDLDLVKSTRDYNRDFAHNIANMRLGSELSAADTEVQKYISARQHIEPPGTGLTTVRQAMYDEVAHRVTGWQGDSNQTNTMKVVNTIKDITFLRHLFSPHYSIMNSMQPYMTTGPVLSSRHGIVSTQREMRKAFRLGRRKAVVAGLKQSLKSGLQVFGQQQAADNDAWWRQQVAGEPDAAELQDVFDEVRSLGWGASSGIEAPGISELDKNVFEKGVGRLVNIAKALPEAIEGVNRYTTAVAAYRLARQDGMSHAQAKSYAALTVEETQGGYGAANNPTFFQNPLLQPATQFRKYGLMYGQLFWRNVAWAFAKPQERAQAAKAVAGLAFSTTVLAGALGVPLVEPLRMLVNAAAAAGLSDDDWEDKEQALQKWLAEMISWTTGSKSLGEALAEANLRGYTRLIEIDTSGTFGNDNLFLFGQPKSLDEEGIYAWLAKAMFGAAGGMGADAAKAFKDGDYAGMIPWPKLIDNIQDAIKLKTEGTVSKTTGEQYHKPFSLYESAVKGLGFRPAEESRPFEGGGASQRKAERRESGARKNLMSQWRNAKGAERARIFREEIRDWNRAHKNPDDKIQMQDLMRSVRSKKAEEKRRKREEQYED